MNTATLLTPWIGQTVTIRTEHNNTVHTFNDVLILSSFMVSYPAYPAGTGFASDYIRSIVPARPPVLHTTAT